MPCCQPHGGSSSNRMHTSQHKLNSSCTTVLLLLQLALLALLLTHDCSTHTAPSSSSSSSSSRRTCVSSGSAGNYRTSDTRWSGSVLPWLNLPGADAAAFTDPLMRAAAASDNGVSGKMYDTANNWTTVKYAWTSDEATRLGRLVGAWDAPKQQLQWWMGKRQVQTDVTVVPTGNTLPRAGKFYRKRADGYPGGDPSACTTRYPDLSNWGNGLGITFADTSAWQAALQEPDGRSAQVYFVYNASGPCGGKVWLPEGVTIDPVSNTWNWELRPDLLGMLPKRPRLSMQESIDGFWTGVYEANGGSDFENLDTNSNFKWATPVLGSTYNDGKHTCSKDQQGTGEADNQAARELLRSMLLPGGADITWEYNSSCTHQSSYQEHYYGSWKLVKKSEDDFLGPNAVYLDGKYPAPVPEEPPLEQIAASPADVYYDYDDNGDQTYGKLTFDTPTLSSPKVFTQAQGVPAFSDPPKYKFYRHDATSYSQQHVRFGMFDSSATYAETFSAGYFWGPAAEGALPAAWYGVSWCPHEGLPTLQQRTDWAPGNVKCTLSITPVQGDLSSSMPTCAASLPQGIPFITCRRANGTLLDMPDNVKGTFFKYDIATHGRVLSNAGKIQPDGSRNARIVAGVEIVIAPQKQSIDTDPPKILGSSGKLPDVACNKRAYSPRFGGRCAAPVVQYLAYDEAYHEASNRAAYGLPEYGGCLAGGLMRSLPNAAQWSTFYSWWTPPLWPADAWYNLKTILGSDAAADAFLNDQESLNSLFVYQKEFKVPADQSPAGCFKIVLTLNSNRWCVVPKPMGAGQPPALQHVRCPTHDTDQCWYIDGDLSVGARIMHSSSTYEGLCMGLQLSPPATWPLAPSMTADAVRLLPCTGTTGYVRWKQANPSGAGYFAITHPACTGSQDQPRECRFGICFVLPLGSTPGPVSVIDIRYVKTVPSSAVLAAGRANYRVEVYSPVWDSFKALKGFWDKSFASSPVDLRAHRTRFAPPGGRQGPYGRSAFYDGSRDVCDAASTYAAVGITSSKEACGYHASVKLSSTQYTSDSCAADWLYKTSLTGVNTTQAPICYPGSSFLYTHVNECDNISNDMRLTDLPGGPGTDKCVTQNISGDRTVKADDLWSAVVSYEHDPCGWPFVECVADCSLPSNIANKIWTAVAGTNRLKDGSDRFVGCINSPTDCSDPQDRPMLHPRVANQIAAIDWRNLTLYSSQLDFSAFRGAPGRAVWYLNLNFNMLGGNLTALEELPDIFPNLIHLGLAHCSAGKFAPEYSWQQAQMPYCHDRWVNGKWNETTGPNPACYCPDTDWKDITVIPSVGSALQNAANGGASQAGVVTGVTRMLYGSIPRSWGRMANGNLAAWHDTLISVNLAGHHTITGDLPPEWYDQTAFPRLHYLKLKGTQVQPTLTAAKLKWTDEATCDAVRWTDYSTQANSILDVTQTCPGSTCTACNWWPLKSAAPWYYSQVNCTGEWAWSPCNSTCAGGVKFYRFNVLIPAANGGTCPYQDGYYNQTSTAGCPTNPCPIDCQGSWTAWSACNGTCGAGMQSSTYVITMQEAYGGQACVYANSTVRYQDCASWDDSCTVPASVSPADICNATADGTFVYQPEDCDCTTGTRNMTFTYNSAGMSAAKNESCATIAAASLDGGQNVVICDAQYLADCSVTLTWGACNKTCGGGYQTGTYTRVPAGKCGLSCDALGLPADGSTTTRVCNTDACTDRDCTFEWVPVGPCNTTCGLGVANNEFVVTSPAIGSGACAYANGTQQLRTCNATVGCPCIANWTAWTACNQTCGSGSSSRTYIVTQAAAPDWPQCAYANSTMEYQACNTQPCPVDCVSAWTDWSACNATCNGGNRSRVYYISVDGAHGGINCTHANATVEWEACGLDPCPVNCTASWTPWNTCNATCGGGSQSRVFDVSIPAAYNGTCEAANGTLEWQACNTDPCPINCTGNWTDWDTCSVPCGGGNQSSVYLVAVEAMHGGDNCSQVNGTTRWQACNVQPCPVDCVSSWTNWTDCNATCNGGNRSRVYYISVDGAHGGVSCIHANETVEWEACNTDPCPINCTGSWAAWGACNATCGGGSQSREFEVTTPAAFNGTCEAANGTLEWQACNTDPCPINCTGNWTDWDTCSISCGGGNQSSVFIISTDAMHGGDNCSEINGTTRWQACNIQPCPVDCVSAWTGWSDCNATCNGGNRSRVYYITVDGAHGGVNCSHPNVTVEWEACNVDPCPINCTGNWTDWGACNATCGGGSQSRVYEVSIPAAYNGTCEAANGTLEWQACNISPCPINCTGNWTDWDTCNATCGGGNQFSAYLVSVDAMHGGDNCSEVNGTIRWQACNTQPCPVNCTGSWTTWTTCNATCAGGNQSRVYYITQDAAYGGINCSYSNETVQEQACNTQPCPVNCVGSWGAWSECNKTCGSGTRTRVYGVSVAAAYSGTACPSANGTVESQDCNTDPCPVNCTGIWSGWNPCNATCGGGNQSRVFGITTPAVGTGTACVEADGATEWRPCNTQACSPQLGEGETCPGLLPDLYLPRGTAVQQLPVLVVFPSAESKAAYCPANATSGNLDCTVTLQALPVLQTDTTVPGSVQQITLACAELNAPLTCRMVLPLGPEDARYEVKLLPIDNPVLLSACATGSFDPVVGEVILDSVLPTILNMQLDVAPTTQTPVFKLLITFSEPVSWLANATTNSPASTPPTEDPTALAGTGGTRPTSYTSSRLLLTNAALLNISMVPGTAAVLANGDVTNAATGFVMWFRSWSGARAVVEVLGAAYQDIAGNRGEQDTSLEVTAPGTDLLQRASTIASAATAISATASALSAAAAATTASGAGGATSLLRSVGHTQFLAMSVSLAVPWMPPEYLELCAGLEWSNLVHPATAALKLASNTSTYADSQLAPSRRRQLLSKLGTSTTTNQADITDWLDQHSRQYGSYRTSTDSSRSSTRSTAAEGTLVFTAGGAASNGSLVDGVTNALIMSGTSRWPAVFSVRELQMSIIALFVVTIVASILQFAVIWLWKLLRFNPEDLPNLLRFPKPQVVVYTLLMVPVVYGGSKLLSSPLATSRDWSAGVATIVLIPLPPLAFWAYVLIAWHRALVKAAKGDVKRSKSNILRAYGSGIDGESNQRGPSGSQRGGATLALLGDVTDNPTLIIRDKKPGEEDFEQFHHDSDSDDSSLGSPVKPSSASATAVAAAAAGRPWKARDSGAGASPRRPAAVNFLPADADEQQEGRPTPIATRSFTRSARAAGESGSEADGWPLGEGVDEEQSSLAEAWQAARAAGQPISSWGGGAGAGANSSPTAAQRTSGRFQLSFSANGSAPAGAPGSADGGRLRKQDTWVSGSGATAAAGATAETETMQQLQQQQTQEVAATKFLEKHGFMVDELVGDEPEMAVQRSQWKILLLHVISILQRCTTAVMFGFFHFRYISITQLGMLIALHAGFIGYLVVVRPYASWLLLLSDVLAYLCELTVLAVAVLLQSNPEYTTHQQLAHALIACYFFDVAAMVVPELLRYLAMGWAWVQARRARQQREKQGQIEGDADSGSDKRRAGRGAGVTGVDGVVTVSKRTVGEKDGAAAKAAAAAALKLSGSGGK